MNLGIKPCLTKGGQILPRVAIKEKFISYQRMGNIRSQATFGHSIFWD
jgi:hypothetical protein